MPGLPWSLRWSMVCFHPFSLLQMSTSLSFPAVFLSSVHLRSELGGTETSLHAVPRQVRILKIRCPLLRSVQGRELETQLLSPPDQDYGMPKK